MGPWRASGRVLRWRTAWVTGASSGIGRALAIELSRRGVRVAASARRADELSALAAAQPGVTAFPLDVTDLAATKRTADEITARLGVIDLAIFNAGVGRTMGAHDYSAELAAKMMAVNYQGLANGIEAVLPAMLARRAGHIALMASIAGYRGLPNAAAYSPSKAAAISLAETLEPELDAAGINISVINPGFVATPMTDNAKHPLPYLISADETARRIVAGLDAKHFEVAFPWTMKTLAKLGRMLPYPAYFWFMSHQLQPRPADDSSFTNKQP